MKYMGMPMGMWALFAKSFRQQLTAVFGYDADAVARDNHGKGQAEIQGDHCASCPHLKRRDRFKMNIVNCAMLGRVYPLHARSARRWSR